jgi:SH3-like domain-containing protein
LPRFLSIGFAFLALCVFGLRTIRVETGLKGRVIVTADVSAAVRSEPNVDLPIILQLERGKIVERRDVLPGWLRIESEGTVGWIEDRQVFDIDTPDYSNPD